MNQFKSQAQRLHIQLQSLLQAYHKQLDPQIQFLHSQLTGIYQRIKPSLQGSHKTKVGESLKQRQKHKGKQYKRLTKHQRQFVLNSSLPKKEVCQRFNICQRTYYRILNNGSQMGKGGRTPIDSQMEVSLYKHILLSGQFSNKSIKKKARQLCDNKDFKATQGWLTRFKMRYKVRQLLKLQQQARAKRQFD